MSTDTANEARHQLEEVIARLMRGERDPAEARRACERMDRQRERLQKRIGTVEVAVDLIRAGRDE